MANGYLKFFAEKLHDFFGAVYMLGSKNNNKFITVYHFSQFMAQIALKKTVIRNQIEKKWFIYVCEPDKTE